MKTLGQVLDANKGIGPGFDTLRILLALAIVALHTLSVTNQYFAPNSLDDTPIWIVHYSLVPMFFALSGFLISGSAERLSLKNFLINRGLRIVPALATDTVFCALIIGPIFTTANLHSYFFSQQFFSFFLNIVGWVHFTLPGVFEHLPVARVNGSLWTVPFELACYVIISILILTKVIRSRFIVLATVIVYMASAVALLHSGLTEAIPSAGLRKVLSVAFIEHEAQAVTAFLFGIIIFQNRRFLPYSKVFFAGCVLAVLAVALGLKMAVGQGPMMRFILLPALAYIVLFLGMTPLPLNPFFKTGDYSYGIYLYHQPLLQIVVTLFPALALGTSLGSAFVFCLTIPFIIAFAWLSWRYVEKPTLALRKRFTIMAKIRGVNDGASPTSARPKSPASPAILASAATTSPFFLSTEPSG